MSNFRPNTDHLAQQPQQIDPSTLEGSPMPDPSRDLTRYLAWCEANPREVARAEQYRLGCR